MSQIFCLQILPESLISKGFLLASGSWVKGGWGIDPGGLGGHVSSEQQHTQDDFQCKGVFSWAPSCSPEEVLKTLDVCEGMSGLRRFLEAVGPEP